MGGNQGPVEVGTITLHKQPVPLTTLLPGRVAASATAEIRPQVGGIIESVAFTEGSLVEKGDLLFQLPTPTRPRWR
jgi:membrane fusion protein (multidrug efflux system)